MSWVTIADRILAAGMVPVAILVLLSGLDDLMLYLACAFLLLRKRQAPGRHPPPSDGDLASLKEKRLAIVVPCWHESPVIARMITHNIAAIHYGNYDFFIGAYPNDEATLDIVRELEERYASVHLAVCPHDGPTSKADCLNWIYQRMLLFEEEHGLHYDGVITHDAEDLIHPESLTTTNYYLNTYDFVQIPVLALATPLSKITHGVYCDDFAEFQIKDMRARELMGSFIPSNGVGTAYSRSALERLAQAENNRIFEPACLTEDYENGMRLHRLGCRQIFVPIRRGRRGIVATREYFPSTTRAAIRQRTRWVMGIALQTWERHGWKGGPGMLYWLWRDRKGLIGSPLSLITNVIFACGVATWIHAKLYGHPWGLESMMSHRAVVAATLGLQTIHLSIRMVCVARIYGWVYSLGVPVRLIWANYINASATLRAIFRYMRARLRHEPLIWIKTEHAYPSRSALREHKRLLGEILVGSGYIDAEELEYALSNRPPGSRLGEYLMQRGTLTENDLYEALSLQQNLPACRLIAKEISRKVARALPRRFIREWKVLPFRVEEGNLLVASPEIPTDELNQRLRGFTGMTLQFHLMTPANFEEVAEQLL